MGAFDLIVDSVQDLGQYMIMQTPVRAMKAPIKSNLSGGILSIFQPQSMANKMKIPPYAA